jgi:hypothetical protein
MLPCAGASQTLAVCHLPHVTRVGGDKSCMCFPGLAYSPPRWSRHGFPLAPQGDGRWRALEPHTTPRSGASALRHTRAASRRTGYGSCGCGLMRLCKLSQAYSRGCGRPCTFSPPRLPLLGGGNMRWPHYSCR